ncbi:phosphotransferase family protein [Phenylobacterium sp. J367]|uniref:phosphotransferase family protein n=1 Tax=Phenylobacterium sp. J367 TaxID=2898435 RepID=UPI0021519BC1|nr:phosphotransferase family protein [Phenylobacterium sp. J367]MCR5879953.1 phosphotransferase family protein [Phenylobacterium sp. J367]
METPVAEALPKLAQRLAGEGARVEGAQRLSGGASMETWTFDIVSGAAREGLILRRRTAPFDPETARSISLATEAALIRAAAKNTALVPHVRHVCDDSDGLGEAYVMVRAAGETLGKKIVEDSRFDGVRPKLAFQCGEVLARIHATPPPDGLNLKTVDAVLELDRYEEVYRTTGAQRPVLELAFQYLRKRTPEPAAPVLLHGDFRNGNIMFDPERGVAAVLDWELAHIGDPAEDMGWICTNSWRFGRPEKPVGGFGDYADLLAGYEAAGGRPIDLARLRFWQMLGSLRWGVMCLTMYMSWQTGVEKSVERPMIGRRVSETEADLVVLLEQGL